MYWLVCTVLHLHTFIIILKSFMQGSYLCIYVCWGHVQEAGGQRKNLSERPWLQKQMFLKFGRLEIHKANFFHNHPQVFQMKNKKFRLQPFGLLLSIDIEIRLFPETMMSIDNKTLNGLNFMQCLSCQTDRHHIANFPGN